jgi:ribonuclease HI
MKTLKLDHNLAELVLQGKKTSTWRMYDDKDLSVNDEVRLIDKVNPKEPATWRIIGTVRINEVIQKRLGDLEPEDYTGHEDFPSREKMLETYRGYYGPQVDLDTPVKIIRFSFNNDQEDIAAEVVNNAPTLTEIKMFADGGSRGNPGPSASGFAIFDMADKLVVKKSLYLGITTNNQAEYQSLKLGLEEALRMRVRIVHVHMDSLLVVNQMLGIFKVKNRDLWPIYTAIKELAGQFKSVTFRHVPRALNKVADAAVNEALDEELKS